MTCGELWIKVDVNHLLFYPLSSRQSSLVALCTCGDFTFLSLLFSLSPLSSCLSSITLFTYTTPHANCFPRVTVAHTPCQFLTHLQSLSPPPASHFTPLRIQNSFAFPFFLSLPLCLCSVLPSITSYLVIPETRVD